MKKNKQKINFHNTDKLKEFFNHKLIIILIFFKRIKLESFFLIMSVSYIIINYKHDINFLFFKTGHARIQIVLSEGVQHFFLFD